MDICRRRKSVQNKVKKWFLKIERRTKRYYTIELENYRSDLIVDQDDDLILGIKRAKKPAVYLTIVKIKF